MKITVNEWQLSLIDAVCAKGKFGQTREGVLQHAIFEHARYVAAGGGPYDLGDPGVFEIDAPEYGPLRDEILIKPITGKAIPVHAGEVLRIIQVEGGTCVDYNAYNLHDYKEYLDCGFNRIRGPVVGKGTIVWSGSPRGRPMYAIGDQSDRY
jgi:uncharacterized protein YcgI (DUF1989 family)